MPSDEDFARLAATEDASFWFRGRNALLVDTLRARVPGARAASSRSAAATATCSPRSRAPGPQIERRRQRPRQPPACEHARRRLPDARLLRADARALPFDGEFDVAGAFDVIEHVAEDEAVLAALRRAVRPGGGVIVTVPQHRWLWSETDRYSGHQRRYRRRELAAKLERAGLRLRWASSFVTLLLPLMAASRAWQAVSRGPTTPGASCTSPAASTACSSRRSGSRRGRSRAASGCRPADRCSPSRSDRCDEARPMTRFLYPLATLLLTVYGQLVVKWQVDRAGALPADLGGKIAFVGQLLVNPWVISVFVAAFLAAASWMLAMTHFSLSDAYPVMALSFGLVLFGSALWLGESLTWPKVAGVAIIAVGLVVGSR